MVKLTREQKIIISVILFVIVSIQINLLDDDMILVMTAMQSLQRNSIVKIPHFYEVIVPQMIPRLFRRFFRMHDDTMNRILSYLSLKEPFTTLLDKGTVCRHKKVAMTCAYLGSKQTIVQLAHLFGVSEDTFLHCTDTVMDALIANLHEIISWPSKNEFADYAKNFEDVGRFFPNVIGAIDGLHLEIELTEERRFEPSFINYKQFHSMHLQAVATYDLRFIHVFAGWPGRSADSGVLRHSPLSRTIDDLMECDSAFLTDSYHIVGDKAFPLSKHILTPHKKSQLRRRTRAQKIYNKHLASKRQNVERAFGLLVKRFPRLHLLNQKSTRKKIKVILAACALHNICIMENDNIELFLRKASKKRPAIDIQNYDPNAEQDIPFTTDQGNIKRILITNEVYFHYLRFGN